MQKLTSSSTPFQIWYHDLLIKVLKHIKAGLDYAFPLNQAKSKYKGLFNPNLFEEDVNNMCKKNNLRFYYFCKKDTIYIGPL